MIVEVQVTVHGSRAAVWAAVTNIENSAEIISGIENIEVVEKPANGLVGLKWRETRMLLSPQWNSNHRLRPNDGL